MSLTISVITPSFNQAQFLPINLTSVRTQTFPNVEHIVVDPGSTDGSRNIARAADGVVLIAEPDRGQSDGVTKGFALAKGDILGWLNSDDFYPSASVLTTVAEAFADNRDIDIIYGKVDFVDERGEFLRHGYVNDKANALLESFTHQVGIVQPGVFLRRSVFEKLGGPSEQYEYCMDYEFWVRIATAGMKWKFIDKTLAHHRWWSGMKTSKGRNESLIEHMRVCERYFGFIHWKWLDRYAEYLASGMDGIVNHGTATDPATKSAHAKEAIYRFVSQEILRQLENAATADEKQTLDYIKQHAPGFRRHYWDASELPGASESSFDPDALKRPAWRIMSAEGSNGGRYRSYRVPQNFHRFFDEHWLQASKNRSLGRLVALSDKRRAVCVIVGNGPSLANTDLTLLDQADVIISNFAVLNPKLLDLATMLTVTNDLVAKQGNVDFNKIRKPKVVPFWLSNTINETEETCIVDATVEPVFCRALDGIFSWRSTVSYFNLQLAWALGYRKVILVGFDHFYSQPPNVKEGDLIVQTGDDLNHFDPRYFKGRTWQAADTHNMEAMYRLAKTAYEADGREIVNCTIGGRLEVFRRGDLKTELNLAPPAPKSATPPRLLLIDHTLIGDGTATGEVKANLFADWPIESLLQVGADENGNLTIAANGRRVALTGDRTNLKRTLWRRAAAFAPDIILYRPVPATALLHAAAMELVEQSGLPFAIWIMDDWPSALALRDPAQFARLDPDFRKLVAGAAKRFSISSEMSHAFGARYGAAFTPIANGVDSAHWDRPAERPAGAFCVRYAGSLADNMTLTTLRLVAEAVESLARRGFDISFEIKTRKLWADSAAPSFAALKRTRFIVADMTPEEYRAWVSEAHATIIAYNFDAGSIDYVRYSLANKLPECLASGAPLIAVGPKAISTLSLLDELDCGLRINAPDTNAIAAALQRLIESPELCRRLAEKARRTAFERFNIHPKRATLTRELAEGSSNCSVFSLPRSACAIVDETGVVAELLSDRSGREHVMLDVGAHFGTSAAYFDRLGWTIHCFEPDQANRAKLQAKFGKSANVSIDARAVSDKPATGVSFFSSPQSTGISGLHVFHPTHKETAQVEVTTLSAIVEDRSIARVDFLKIDVEGFDFAVLKGAPWDKLTPDVIECEFEDAKTVPLGHNWKDIAEFLRAKGYTIYVSEWHPIIRYGIAHDWRRVIPYPGAEIASDSWGNLLAFRVDPGYDFVRQAFFDCIKFHEPPAAGAPNIDGTAAAANKLGKSSPVSARANSAAPKAVEAAITKVPEMLASSPKPSTRSEAYVRFARGAYQISPRLYAMLRFAKRAFEHVWVRRAWTAPLAMFVALVFGLGFLPQLAPSRALIWGGLAGAVLLSAAFYVAFRMHALAERILTENAALRNELSAQKRADQQLALDRRVAAISSLVTNLDARDAAEAAKLDRRIATISSTVTTRDARDAAEAAKIAKELQTLRAQIDDRAQSLTATVANLDARDAAEAAKLDRRIATISSTVTTRDARDAAEAAKIAKELQTLRAEIGRRARNLSAAIAELDARDAAEAAKIAKEVQTLTLELGYRARNLSASVADLDARDAAEAEKVAKELQTLRAEIGGFNQRYGGLDEITRTLDGKLREIEAQSKSAAELARAAVKDSPPNNAALYQQFNRKLAPEHIEEIEKVWRKRLSINLSRQTLGYMANRACQVEAMTEGRLAASIEDILLRTLVCMGVKRRTLDILEIGTLFGAGVAIMHDALAPHFEKVHLTLLDPLDGYYDTAQKDVLTGQPINEATLRRNFRRIGMQDDDFTLIKRLSTDIDAISEAGARQYDVLVIDGDHSYAGVKTDFENYAHFVRLGGYIVIDDYGSPDWPDVTRYVDEEVTKRSDVALVGTSWRTCIYRVVRPPPQQA